MFDRFLLARHKAAIDVYNEAAKLATNDWVRFTLNYKPCHSKWDLIWRRYKCRGGNSLRNIFVPLGNRDLLFNENLCLRSKFLFYRVDLIDPISIGACSSEMPTGSQKLSTFFKKKRLEICQLYPYCLLSILILVLVLSTGILIYSQR